MYFGMRIGWLHKHIKRQFLALFPCRFFYLSSCILNFVVTCFLNNHMIVFSFHRLNPKDFIFHHLHLTVETVEHMTSILRLMGMMMGSLMIQLKNKVKRYVISRSGLENSSTTSSTVMHKPLLRMSHSCKPSCLSGPSGYISKI